MRTPSISKATPNLAIQAQQPHTTVVLSLAVDQFLDYLELLLPFSLTKLMIQECLQEREKNTDVIPQAKSKEKKNEVINKRRTGWRGLKEDEGGRSFSVSL
jgi:hypothetical protein